MEPSNSISHYRYEPLTDPEQYIRLLKIHIDDMDLMSLRCVLESHPIKQLPSYFAISYTWGDPNFTTYILINGGYFEVRYNCAYVLTQAYAFGRDCYYWCDAICINQVDNEEKGCQVAMMGFIYRLADQVLACVGDHYHDSEFLYRHMGEMSLFNVNGWSAYEAVIMANHSLRRRRLLRALLAFFNRPYFHRLWVFQELALAKKVTVCCGNDTVFIQRLCQLTKRFLSEHSRVKGTLGSEMFLRTSQHSALEFGARILEAGTISWRRIGLQQAIESVTSLLCANPRDKIYGVLSLVWTLGHNIHPDYEKDRFDLALEVLHEVIPGYSDYWFPFAYLLAEILELLEQPSYRLDSAARHGMLAPNSPTTTNPRICPLIGISEDEQKFGWTFRGWPLYGHGSTWNLYHASTTLSFLIDRQFGPIRIWTEDSGTKKELEKGQVDILLPGQVQPGNWCLFCKMSNGKGATMPMVLIAKEESDGSFTVTGRALIAPPAIACCPWDDKQAPKIHIYMSPVDSMVLLCTEFTRQRTIISKGTNGYHLGELTDEDISKYLQTRVSGSRGSMYA